VTGFAGDTQQFSPFHQNEDCFGNELQPFSISNATWSSTNSSVATVTTTGFATAQNPGSTNIQGTWTAFLWDLNPNNTCTKTTFQPLADALCDVLGVQWTTPHGLNGQDGVVPISSGTPPQGSPAYVNSTTITATGSPSGGSYSWSTSSNKVSLSNTTAATVTVTGLAESASTRDVTITDTYTRNNVSIPSQVPFTVQKPTFMSYVSADASGTASCPSGQSGKYKDMTWQLQDKNHNPIPYALPTYDTLTNVTPNSCFALAAGEGTAPGAQTNSAGRWSHHYALCSTACNSGGNCSVTGTQKYFSNGFQIDHSYTMTCTTITVDGH
jgi:hypothetical protein